MSKLACYIVLLSLLASCGGSKGQGQSTTTDTKVRSFSPSMDSDSEDYNPADYVASSFGNPAFAEIKNLSPVAQNLRAKIEQVMQRPEFQPGFPNWEGRYELGLPLVPGTQRGVYWSNAAFYNLANEFGFDADIILNEKDGRRVIEWTNSFSMGINAKLATEDSFSKLQEVDAYKAQELANKGQVIFVYITLNEAQGRGRAGVVAPSNSVNGPLIATVSPVPGYYEHFSWVKIYKKVPKYYALPTKIEYSLPYNQLTSVPLYSKIADVISRIEYQPGYPDWDGIYVRGVPRQPGADPGVTWCNEAAYTIATEQGYDARKMVNAKGIHFTNANEMALILAEKSAMSSATGINEVGAEEAQRLANQGRVVVVATPMTKYSSIGHIGVVSPDNHVYNPKIGPLIGQAGSFNGFVTLRKWRVDWGAYPRFYALPAKDS